MKNKKNLDFDLDFLESVDTEKPNPKAEEVDEDNSQSTIQHDSPKKYSQVDTSAGNSCLGSCLGRIIGLVITVVVIVAIRGAFGGFSSDGQVPSSCDTAKLNNLEPSESQKTQIDTLKSTIDSMVVNNYSQSSVDQYNEKVDQYNNLKNTYNNQVDTYNNYLNSSCK